MTLNVSGVGANLALSLKNLRTEVRLLTMGAEDSAGKGGPLRARGDRGSLCRLERHPSVAGLGAP